MKDSHKYISTQIEKEIPQFIRHDYPHFVNFIKTYYSWMESNGAPYHFISNALNFSDVDRTSIQLLDEFSKNFLQPLPEVINENNNIATLVKNIEQYYSARGAEKSFEFLFRLFEYQEDADHNLEFYYPSYDMLRVSDGKWVSENSLKIIDPVDNIINWEAGEAVGQTSGAKAVIDEIKLYESDSGEKIAEIFLIEFDVLHNPEKFVYGESVKLTSKELDIIYVNTERVFYKIKITNPSKFYVPDQRIKIISSGIGEDAHAVIDYTGKGSVTGFSIISGGLNYNIGDKIYTDNNKFGSGAYGRVTNVGVLGEITEIKMISNGHDYRYIQNVLIDSINGEDAIIMMESDDIGTIKSVEIRDFGINYSASDTTVEFNTMMRIHSIFKDLFIGEEIIGQTSNARGIIEYWDKDSNTISVNMLSGLFQSGETFEGQRYNGTAVIYDINLAEGVMEEGCLCSYHGRYINDDGHISSLKYIQDSYFYQMFSYMLKTYRDKKEWGGMIENVHPAGTIGFSYRDVISHYILESNGGFISPSIDTTEFYKFRWQPDNYHGGHIRYEANTQMKQYKNVVIDDCININNNKLNKTSYCFGAEILLS